MSRVIHFEIPSNDPERSAEFYSKSFGWLINQFGDDSNWLATTGEENEHGINGAIIRKKDPSQPVINTIQVDSIEKAIFRIESYGGKIVVPKAAVAGVGWLAYFTDPDGNLFGVMQQDTKIR